MNFIPLSWKELISYTKHTNFKCRPVIIIELDDNMNKKYNAIVVKYDNNKNVHIRYLDNPFYEDKYWWTGNKNNLPGLNQLCYHAKFLDDSYDEMDGLRRVDFQENGYDDIINYNKESFRFFKSSGYYPYLDGVQGNVHVNNYYISEFSRCLSENRVPNCIKNKTHLDQMTRVKVPNIKDTLLYNILEGLPKDFSPIIDEYCTNKSKKIKPVISNFKKLLSFMMTYKFINNNYEVLQMSVNELLTIKDGLYNNRSCNALIKIIPYLIGYNIKIFHCSNRDFEIEEYSRESCKNKNNKYIYILKYLDNSDTLV